MFSKNDTTVVLLHTLLVAWVVLFFQQCIPRDPVEPNQITVGTETRYLRQAVLRIASTPDTVAGILCYRHQLLLFSQGMNHAPHTTAGLGTMVSLDIVCSTPGLVAGNYTLAPSPKACTPFNLQTADVYIDFDHAAKTGRRFFLTTAHLSVLLSGKIFTLDLEGEDQTQSCNAYFTGVVTVEEKD